MGASILAAPQKVGQIEFVILSESEESLDVSDFELNLYG